MTELLIARRLDDGTIQVIDTFGECSTLFVRANGYIEEFNGAVPPPPAPPPPPPPPAPDLSGFVRPADRAELQSILQWCADNGGVVHFDGNTPPIQLGTETLEITLKAGHSPRIYGNGLRLQWNGTDGVTDAVRFRGTAESFVISGFNLNGNRYATPGCRDGFVLENGPAVNGQKAMWLFTLSDMHVSWCGRDGISFIGDVFECRVYNPTAENCWGNGMTLNTPAQDRVISNVRIFGADLSRNNGYGLELQGGTSSVDLIGASFVQNGLGGINCPNGMRNIIAANGENTGETFINMPSSAYGSTVAGVELSSSGQRGRGEQPLSLPSKYLIKAPPNNLTFVSGTVSSYGTYPSLSVYKP